MKNTKLVKIFLGGIASLVVVLIIGQIIFSPFGNSKSQAKGIDTSISKINNDLENQVMSITVEELSKFDGKNGNPAYIAVNGTIYDVTNVSEWNQGTHNGYSSGLDLTDAFAKSPHTASILNVAPVVGKLGEASATSDKEESKIATNQTSVSLDTNLTLEKLSKFNGKNGNPAYIAVNGTIYDVTSVADWSQGTHNGYSSGLDLTDAFAKSPHAASILNVAPVVGKLVESSATSVKEESKIADVVSSASLISDMTVQQLSQFNGKNGNPAYIAVNGIIYDVTNVSDWSQGTHNGYSSGLDLTAAFATSPHAASILNAAPVVGKLVEANATSVKEESKITTNNTAVSVDKSFTLEKLSQFNGKNGNPAYIAVNGTIYDVTNVSAWSQGTHKGYSSGLDLTAAFTNSPHAASILNVAPVVGKLVLINTPVSGTVINQSSVSSETGWTLEKLSQFNGKNGNPAYISVNGTIYDVTNVSAWSQGTHKGYSSGLDLTAAFANSPHAASILNVAPIVGKLDSSVILPTSGTIINNNSDDDDDEYEDEDEDDEDEDEDED